MSSNVVWFVLEFGGFAALTIALNLASRARRRRNAARWYPHNDPINPWMPSSQGDQQHGRGDHPGGGGGHHHGGWSGGGDSGSPGGHHG